VSTYHYFNIYNRVTLLSCPWAWLFYCLESLYPMGQLLCSRTW